MAIEIDTKFGVLTEYDGIGKRVSMADPTWVFFTLDLTSLSKSIFYDPDESWLNQTMNTDEEGKTSILWCNDCVGVLPYVGIGSFGLPTMQCYFMI